MPSPRKPTSLLSLLQVLLLLLLLPATTTALTLHLYTGQKCTGQALGSWTGGPHQGCQTLFAGQATSAIVRNNSTSVSGAPGGGVDGKNNVLFEEVVFFRGGKCDPKMEIVRSGSQGQEGCVRAVGYGSFRVRGVKRGKKGEKEKEGKGKMVERVY
ncbi:hypothetical protein VTN00DRAFT_4621 [Thermoascus crustaceus]|uniref:uncharacterized protein n=1 Tax=Thermoascus crustaceus TaxID=5088 RepID=UPI0037439495